MYNSSKIIFCIPKCYIHCVIVNYVNRFKINLKCIMKCLNNNNKKYDYIHTVLFISISKFHSIPFSIFK